MNIQENISLKELTTFKVGGNARFFCIAKNEKELLEALDFAKKNKMRFFILGGGSNILISDEGFDGIVIKMENKGIDFDYKDNGEVYVNVASGENWDNLVNETVEKELYGLENLSYIPGTVGASPVQNIGAYESEVKDTIYSVRVYDTKSGEFLDLENEKCNFSYRNSLFKKEKNRYIVISVTFRLKRDGEVNISYKDLREYFNLKNDNKPSLVEVRNAVIDIRKNKLPDINMVGTAGSFFKNPIIDREKAEELKDKYSNLPVYETEDKDRVKVSLAWIIDHICEYKNVRKGNVGIYKNQALVIVNEGDATAEEIIDFVNDIKKIVKEKTDIEIEMEVEQIY